MVELNQLQDILKQKGAGSEPEQDDTRSAFAQTQDSVLRNFNVGLSRTLGIPRAITDVAGKFRDVQFEAFGIEPKETPNIIPSGEEIQNFFAEQGMAFPFGEEPETIGAIAKRYNNYTRKDFIRNGCNFGI